MPRNGKRRLVISWRWLTLVAWCGFLFFYGLSGPLYRTEALRAIIGQSALDGHWLAPTLYGEPFLTKPPGAYAAIGLASLPFGRVTEETSRLPSAIAATATVLFAFSTLRRFLGASQAFLAALLLPVSILWLDKVPSAEIDMLQLAWVSVALFCFLRAEDAKDAGSDSAALRWWVAALMSVAGGFLTKWTAPAFFYLAVGPYLLCRGRVRWLFGREHLLAAGLAVGVSALWAAMVAREVGWRTLVETVSAEGAQRFLPNHAGKKYPWEERLAFPFVVLGATLPWSIPALIALRPSFLRGLDDRTRNVVLLLHCWAWPNLLFWSLPAQHNVRYVLPICPAITLLGVVALWKWFAAFAASRPTVTRTGLLLVIALWLSVKVVFVERIVLARTAGRNARETGEQISRLVPEGEILYLCRLKDEGVLFYYGRPARRQIPIDPAPGTAVHAVLLDAEWDDHLYDGRPVHLAELRDQQGAAIHVVRLHGPTEDEPVWFLWHLRTRLTSSPSPP